MDIIYPKLDSVESIDKAITSAIEAAKTMKKKIQIGAIGCMILAGLELKDEDGKDINTAELACEKANYLVEQVGAGVKGEGLVKFLVYMCGFKVNSAAKKEGFIDVANREWLVAHLQDAKDKMWFDYAPANPFKGFNLAEELQALIKKSNNAVAIGETDDAKAELVKVDLEMLEVLGCLISGTPVSAEGGLRLIEKLTPVQQAA